MSRIGKQIIQIPEQIKVELKNNTILVKGPKGEEKFQFHSDMQVIVNKDNIEVKRPSESKKHKSLHGLTRSIINNMIIGVVNGYEKKLILTGVGYSVELKGKGTHLFFTIGYSHQILIDSPVGVSFKVDKGNVITVIGTNKQKVGEVAAKVRSLRPPEPYKGKGIRYIDEIIHKKAGKMAKTTGVG
ncbi:MAG: 50S ribosomal protein L6 [Candidatus Marinimicrobia bacterium]|nr:50S ribosomal protein L6 [Candidatus Neomarinimicrobiota bacterium]